MIRRAMQRRGYRLTLVAATILIAAGEPSPQPFAQSIPGSTVTIDMVPVTHGEIDGTSLRQFWIGRTEVTWDAYDVFVYGLDEPRGAGGEGGVDAVARPSKPYVSMDRGFGHNGYPAISVSHQGAEAFCKWLSGKTGRRYRLPTAAEWRYACGLGGVTAQTASDHAWLRGNARGQTHAVATKAPDALGARDLWGNAAEWANGADGKPLVMGGSYRDAADRCGCAAAMPPSDDWNASDPQIPKSTWWLADGGFVGFRVVCEK